MSSYFSGVKISLKKGKNQIHVRQITKHFKFTT